jgi:filamentous hemagglutinin family protein
MANANRTFRSSMLLSTAVAALVAMPGVAHAQLVRSGDLVDAIDNGGNGGQLTVVDTTATQTDMTVLAPVVIANWSRFNVPTGTVVNIAPDAALTQATLVNRVIGATSSDISGTINAADVNLWLINQNGILFGDGAAINSASFIGSTLDVSDADLFDFYSGTDLAGNGSSTLRFTGSLGNAIATASPNVSFVTDGTMLFVSEQLNLDATFNAGTGNVAFVAASDLSVTFTPGSPLSYVINAGTTVADAMTIGGSVSGGSIDFRMITAAGVVNALLRVDADLNATTALATDTGIRLLADQGGSATVTVEMDGGISSTGRIDLRTDGSLTATSPMTGSGVFVQGGTGITLDDVTATNGSVQFSTAGSILAGDVASTGGGISFGASNSGSATFSSLVASGGNVAIAGLVPGSITVTGLTQGNSVELFSAGGALNLGNVTATTGNVFLNAQGGALTAGNVGAATGVGLFGGTIAVGNVTAGSGVAQLFASGGISASSVTSLAAGIDIESTSGGAIDIGALSAALNIDLDTDGNVVITGPVTAGGNLRLGSARTPNIVVFSGAVSAQNITVDAASVSAGNLTATAGSITVNSSELIASALRATDDVIVNATNLVSLASVTADSDGDNGGDVLIGQGTTPFNLVISGATTGASAFLRGNTVNVGSVTATGGDATLSAVSLTAGAVSVTGGNANIDALGGITVGPITANAAGMVGGNASVRSNGGGALNIGAIDADGAVALDTTGSITTAAITAGGALTVGGSLDPSTVNFGGNVSAGSVTVDVTGAFTGQNVTATAGGVDIDAGSIGAGNIAATGGNIDLVSGADLSVLDVTANSGTVQLSASGNLTAEDVLASGEIRFAASNSGTASFASLVSTGDRVFVNGAIPGTITVTGAVQGTSVDLLAINGINLGDVTATAGVVLLQAFNGTISAEDVSATGGNVRLIAPGNITTTSITARAAGGIGGAIDVDSTGGGNLSVGNLASDGLITLDTTGSITTGTINALGALTVGGSREPSTVTFTGNASAASVTVDVTGAFSGQNVTATAGAVDIDAATIDARDVSATGGNVLLVAPGAISTTGITARAAGGIGGAIDVDSTAGGNLSVGNLASDGAITLDTSGSITTGTINSLGALTVGGTAEPNAVTFTGNASAASVAVDVTGAFIGQNVTATAGGVDIDAGSIGAGNIAATGGNITLFAPGDIGVLDVTANSGTVTLSTQANLTAEDVSASGNITFAASNTGTASFASLISTGGRVASLGLTPSNIVVSGATQGTEVSLIALNTVDVGDVTATAGDATLIASNGTVSAEDVSATGGDVRLFAPGAITTTSITARAAGGIGGAINVDSTAGGNLALGNLASDGLITLDTTGSITTGTINSLGALTVGGTAEPNAVTFTGNASAASVTVDVTGAFIGQNVTATAGAVDIDAGSIGAGNVVATGGNIGLFATGDIDVLDVTANSGTVRFSTNANLTAEDVRATGEITFQASNTGTASFASLVSTGDIVAVSGLVPGTLSVTGLVQGTRVSLFAVNAIDVGDVTATAGDALLVAFDGTVSAEDVSATGGNATLAAFGAVTTTSITAVEAGGVGGSIDVDSSNGGALDLGALDASGNIALDTTGSITTGTIDALGALTVGGSREPSTVTFTGNASAASVTIDVTGAFSGQNVTATAGAVDIDAATIDARDVSATGGNVLLVAPGAISTTGITARAAGGIGGAIDVDSTAGGNLSVGNLASDGAITLDTSGSITTGTINSLGALTVGGAAEPSTVTFTGNASAASVTVDVTGAFSGQDVTATAGTVDIDAGSIGAGNIVATGGNIVLFAPGDIDVLDVTANSGTVNLSTQANLTAEDVSASGDITFAASNSGTASFASLTSTGGRVASLGLTPSIITVSGATQGLEVFLAAIDTIDVGDVIATDGDAFLTAFEGTISAEDVSATGGNVALFAPGAITTTSITAREAAGVGGAIDVDSSTGNLALGNLGADGAITLDTRGSITTGTIDALGALTVGGSREPNTVTFTGAASAASITVDTSGAFIGQGLTATAGNIDVDAGTITTGAQQANGGNVNLIASGNITTGAITANRVAGVGGTIDVESTGGALDLGALTAGLGIDLDAAGAVVTDQMTALSGGITVDGQSITIDGATSATGGDVSLTALANIVTGAITAARAGGVGGAIRVNSTGTGANAGTLNVGALLADLGIELDAGGGITTAALTARAGAVDVNGASIAINGATSATGGDVRLLAVGNISTQGITAVRANNAGGSIDVDSSTNGALVLGTLAATQGGIALDTLGTVTVNGTITAGNNLTIGTDTRRVTDVTFGGAVNAANVTVDASGLVTARAMTTTSTTTGAIDIEARDIELTESLRAGIVTLKSFNNGTVGLGSETGTLSLTDAELDRIDAGTLLIDAGSGNVAMADLTFSDAAGRTSLGVASTGTIAITGDITGTGTARTFRFGGAGDGTGVATRITANIDVATIDLGTASLELRGDNIVFGQQALIDMVAGMTLDQQVKELIGNANSMLYAPLNLGAVRTANPVYLTAGSMSVTYGGSALFQNTAPRIGGTPFDGVKLGTTPPSPTAALVLNPLNVPVVTNGTVEEGNVFALFGSINGATGTAAAIGGDSVISVNDRILVSASRVNGCIIGSAEGCVTTIVGNFVLSVPRELISPIVAEEGTPLPFDPLVGGNNESLFSDAATASEEDEECRERDADGVCVGN